jgi:hypothetical protein
MKNPYAALDPDATSTASGVIGKIWGIALVWFALSAGLGASGSLSEHPLLISPFVIVLLVAFVAAFAISPRVRAWSFAFDTRTLVTVQAVRTAGMSFPAAYGSAN